MPLEQAQQKSFKIYDQIESTAIELKNDTETYGKQNAKLFNDRVSELQNDLVNAKDGLEVHQSLQDFAKDASKLIKWQGLPTEAQVAAQDVLRGINRSVRDQLADPAVWGQEAAAHYAGANSTANQYYPARDNFERYFMTKVETPKGQKLITDPSKISSFLKDPDAASKALKKEALDNYLDQTKNIADASENYSQFQVAKDSLSSRFEQIANKQKQMNEVAAALSKKSHNPLENLPLVGKFAAAASNPYMLGSVAGKALQGLDTAGSVIKAINEKIGIKARSVFTAATTSGASVEGMSKRAYTDKVNQLKQFGSPQAYLDHMEQHIGPLHASLPSIAPHIQAISTIGGQFLASKIPYPPTQYALDDKWEPTPDQIQKFAMYYKAVDDPISALNQVKNGTLSNETMETLTTVYPKLLDEMRSQLIQDMKQPANYAAKISLAKFMGEPLDSFQTPQSVMANQAVLNAPMQAMQNKGGPKSTVGGLKEIKIADRTRTQTNRVEEDV
jgi:hypothetical protein